MTSICQATGASVLPWNRHQDDHHDEVGEDDGKDDDQDDDLEVGKDDNHDDDQDGGSFAQELAQSTFSNTTNGCTESDFHVCRAPSNYGFIEVSFTFTIVVLPFYASFSPF